jgi:hypothetical protein
MLKNVLRIVVEDEFPALVIVKLVENLAAPGSWRSRVGGFENLVGSVFGVADEGVRRVAVAEDSED